MQAFLDGCAKSVLEGDADAAEKLAREALAKKYAPLDVIEKGFVKGIKEVAVSGKRARSFFRARHGAEAMKRAMAVLQPSLAKAGSRPKSLGHVVIGTIEGDIHDIGKTLVATMLSANGFEITDLARTCRPRSSSTKRRRAARAASPSPRFSRRRCPAEARRRRAQETLARRHVKVMVGGAPCSDEWAREIGADGYAGDAVAAVALAQSSWVRGASAEGARQGPGGAMHTHDFSKRSSARSSSSTAAWEHAHRGGLTRREVPRSGCSRRATRSARCTRPTSRREPRSSRRRLSGEPHQAPVLRGGKKLDPVRVNEKGSRSRGRRSSARKERAVRRGDIGPTGLFFPPVGTLKRTMPGPRSASRRRRSPAPASTSSS